PLLVSPDRNAVVILKLLKYCAYLGAGRHLKPASHYLKGAHVPDAYFLGFPAHNEVLPVVVVKPRHAMAKRHHNIPNATQKTGVKKGVVTMFFWLALNLGVWVVLYDPLVSTGSGLIARVKPTRLDDVKRLSEHSDVCPVYTPHAMDVRVIPKVPVILLPPGEIGVYPSNLGAD